MLKAFIKLILEILKSDRDKNELNGLYILDETPRVFGTKIRRFR